MQRSISSDRAAFAGKKLFLKPPANDLRNDPPLFLIFPLHHYSAKRTDQMSKSLYTSFTIKVNDGVAGTFRPGTVQIADDYLAFRKNSLMAIIIGSAGKSDSERITPGAIASAEYNGIDVILRGDITKVEKRSDKDGFFVLIQARKLPLLTFACESEEEAQTVYSLLK